VHGVTVYRRLTQLEIIEHFNSLLSGRGHPPLSRSAVNRYAVHIEEKNGLLREAREAAEAMVGRLEGENKGDLGRAISEMVKGLVFDLVMRAKDRSKAGEAVSLDTLSDVSLALQRIERASKLGVDRELKVRQELMEEQRRKLDAAVKEGTFNAEAAREARRIMGFDE
jgi:hypothetical protein